MHIIKRGNTKDQSPGTWWGEGSHISIKCPKCGKIGSVGGHDIAEDGKVSPSLVCPREGCDFHEIVMLEDWKIGV